MFEIKESEWTYEEIEKNNRLWNLFKEKLNIKLQKLKNEEEKCVSKFSQQLPSYFECVINYTVMDEPTVASDGHSYERKQLDDLIRKYQGLSPLTRESLLPNIMYPNLALKKAIESYQQE